MDIYLHEWTESVWRLFAGGLWVCMSGLVGPWACAGVVDLQGRLAALSAVLTRGVDGRALAPSLRGTAGTWRQLWSRQGPRKGSLQVCLGGAFPVQLRVSPGSWEKFSQWRGWLMGLRATCTRNLTPNLSAATAPPPPLSPPPPSLSSQQGPGTLSLSASIARPVSRALDWTCS